MSFAHRLGVAATLLVAAIFTASAVSDVYADASQGERGSRDATDVPLPQGWPKVLSLGSADSPGGASELRETAPFGFRYQYLAGGVNSGGGWSTWNPNGSFATYYIQDSIENGVIPVFTYYMLYQSRPGVTQGEVDGVFTNLNNADTMAAYYLDLKLFLQRAGAFPDNSVVLHVEPDMWGFIQQRASQDDARTVPVKVSSSGIGELAGLPDNASGLAQAIARLRDRYAPNVFLAYHMSPWGTGIDPIYSDSSNASIDALAGRSASFFQSLRGGFDISFSGTSDRDAAFKQYEYGDGGASWWHAEDFGRHVRWIKRFVEQSQTRIVLWQIPQGNTKMRAQDNTWNHYQNNHVEWMLDDSSGRHLREYVDAGVVALLFGRGANGATCACDANGDGVTNPRPINGNDERSLSADDDGGFFKAKAADYYRMGAIRLEGASPIVTATPSPSPTRIQSPAATRTRAPASPTRSAQPSATATRTPTPTATRTPTPPPSRPSATSTPPRPIVMPTRTPTLVPTPTTTRTVMPTSAPVPGVGRGCVTNCGSPRFYCDTGTFAFCDDYRDLFCVVPPPWDQSDPRCAFPDASRANVLTADVFSSSAPNYITDEDGVAMKQGLFFNQQEHFHTMVRDGNFGIAVTRHHQPIDLTAERHIHLEVDLKTSARRYTRIMLSPDLTKAIVDDRNGAARPANALDIWHRNGMLIGSVYKNGSPDCAGGCGNLFSVGRYIGEENVRDSIDIRVSQNRLVIAINGAVMVDAAISGGLGFSQAYLYLSQVSYNPCKDGQCSEAEQIFHWDNVSWDGPALPRNGLTPQGQQDVMFNAFRATSCTVKGVPAVPQGGATDGPVWVTWVARMSVQQVSEGDISCNYAFNNNHGKMDLEIVRR